MWYSVNQLLQTGKNAVICTPYIICGKEMYADLKILVNRERMWRLSPMMCQAEPIRGDVQIT